MLATGDGSYAAQPANPRPSIIFIKPTIRTANWRRPSSMNCARVTRFVLRPMSCPHPIAPQPRRPKRCANGHAAMPRAGRNILDSRHLNPIGMQPTGCSRAAGPRAHSSRAPHCDASSVTISAACFISRASGTGVSIDCITSSPDSPPTCSERGRSGLFFYRQRCNSPPRLAQRQHQPSISFVRCAVPIPGWQRRGYARSPDITVRRCACASSCRW